jgi:predicted phosphoribosyltransferase
VVAAPLAGDLDVLLVKKLRAPGNPELAIGAVDEDGHWLLHGNVDVDDEYLRQELAERQRELARQRDAYRSVCPRRPRAGRVCVLVDDGLATGATMLAAIHLVAAERPAALVVAVPVAPPETLQQIRLCPRVDEVVCLVAPPDFAAVGQFYDDFRQVSDAEVMEILRDAAPR